jgi:uncharacterized protein YgbK (DUF1537 family)
MGRMTTLRLLADDLTGALDSAAHFAVKEHAIPVYIGGRLPNVPPDWFALDLASRETDGASAAAIASAYAHVLIPSAGSTSFKKVDSLLRGSPGIEIAAVLREIPAARCVIAPAFPFHGRVTREGLQFVLRDGTWRRTGDDLRATLESLGIRVRLMKPGEPIPAGASLWDSETEDDLRMIAESGALSSEPILWCGSAGLAAALAPSSGHVVPLAQIGRPLLGLFGSDHPVTKAQLRACEEDTLVLGAFGPAHSRRVCERLNRAGVCHMRFDLPQDLDRREASGRITAAIGELTRGIPPPRTLLVAGGETLRSLCAALGTDHLSLVGQLMPGVPVSRMAGGRWDGTEVISKSGAFGGPTLLREIAPRRGS